MNRAAVCRVTYTYIKRCARGRCVGRERQKEKRQREEEGGKEESELGANTRA